MRSSLVVAEVVPGVKGVQRPGDDRGSEDTRTVLVPEEPPTLGVCPGLLLLSSTGFWRHTGAGREAPAGPRKEVRSVSHVSDVGCRRSSISDSNRPGTP